MQSEAVSFLINKTEMHTGENTPAAEQRPDATIDPTVWVDDHGDYLFRYAVVRLRDERCSPPFRRSRLTVGVRPRGRG